MKYIFPVLIALVALAGCQKDNAFVTVTPPDIDSGLVVNIPLDGNAVEWVSGTYGSMNRVKPAPNRHGLAAKALHFEKADSSFIDFGDLANASFTSNHFTISCWVKVTDTLKTIAVLSKRGLAGPWEYSLDNHFSHDIFNLDNWVDNGGACVYGIDPLKASGPIHPGVWQHIAYVADGDKLQVYINGVLQEGKDEHTRDLHFYDTDAHLVIGSGGNWAKNHYFTGDIDDIRMYNLALNSATIQYLAEL